ncbi:MULTISPECIES: hypothetical protein [Rhizobium]|uniref:DUF768 domain-containing protein n=1 Tax=Rhizobium rhododendri TaxID=2506430 RepID=A0ABY8IF84_9HYPH|nr:MULTISPECIES: hypothetical protein [Rhizobium]MBZ5758979.1 hypothetical protein [Rhizobium sp. VS19-DR96]MBZ5764191.1 hypothetical protein [Rhizobium sp. VS19-DR129.2]MBZ5771734.1 hypothetical protein [Rhizobium sp. VS19-DRK62.2]MBZ5783579.1 hypothetical protein [Rhizobium sp. VS19-DR121]MBZ5801747.1 hypothetical protein [Rhizobium sp. VS19-DR181]
MTTTTDWPKEGIQSSDLGMLQAVLDAWCVDKSVDIHSPDAQVAARSLIDWYEFGISDPAELRTMLEG